MVEFRIAHQLVMERKQRYLIPLLYEEINNDELEADLKLYIDTHTYADCKDLVRKSLHYQKQA
jgi:hypothetical protein